MNQKLKKMLKAHKLACAEAKRCFDEAATIDIDDNYFRKADAAHNWLDESAVHAMWILFEANPNHRQSLVNILKRRYLRAVGFKCFGEWIHSMAGVTV
jgi:hypothetical protein